MGLARSTYYDEPAGQPIEEARLVERIKEICAEWPSYGYRRVTAELRATGCLVITATRAGDLAERCPETHPADPLR